MGCERFLPNLNNSSRQDAKTQSFELEQFKIRNIFFKYFLIYQNFSINYLYLAALFAALMRTLR